MKKKLIIEKEILEDLYINKRKTTHEIAEIFDSNRKSVTKLLKKYKIDINPKQRKYELVKKIPFTQQQKEFIVGTLLGDGCIAPHGRKNKSHRLIAVHSTKQKELLLWKKSILGNFVNVINTKTDSRGYETVNFTTVTHDEFSFYYKLFYENNKKIIKDELINYITPFSLAVWIMDDGTLNNKTNLRLCTEGFSEKENEKLQYMLKVNFDIKSKVCKYKRNDKEYCYLSLNKENTIKASKLTEVYFIDKMRYKLFKTSDSSTTLCQTP